MQNSKVQKILLDNYTITNTSVFDASNILLRNICGFKSTLKSCLSYILMWKFRKEELKTTYVGQILLLLDFNLIIKFSRLAWLQLKNHKDHLKLLATKNQ